MYNRYIPQPDGSFRRHPVPDLTQEPEVVDYTRPPSGHGPYSAGQGTVSPAGSAGSFLRNLLPRDFGTEDLLVVLLLLLMAGEDQQGKNTALLTLALYLFL